MICNDLGNKNAHNEGAGKTRSIELGDQERRGTAGPGQWAAGARRQPERAVPFGLTVAHVHPRTRQGPGIHNNRLSKREDKQVLMPRDSHQMASMFAEGKRR